MMNNYLGQSNISYSGAVKTQKEINKIGIMRSHTQVRREEVGKIITQSKEGAIN